MSFEFLTSFSSLFHTDPYYHQSEWRTNKALSPIEAFTFHQLSSAISYTISAPFTRLKTILQMKHTIQDFNIDTNISKECLQHPSLSNIVKYDGITGLFAGNLYSILRIFAQNMLHLVIKQKIRRRFFSTRRSDSYLKYIFKTFISGYIGNVIAKNFTDYLLITAIKKRLGISQMERFKFGITESSFFSTNLMGFIYRSAWFLSVYAIEPFIIPNNYWLKRISRKFIPLLMPYPFYTIRNTQILTNESLYNASKALIHNYGWKCLFDGLYMKIIDESIVLCVRELMGLIKYHYADWRYDISENRKRRTGVINLSKLCKYRELMLKKEHLLTYGYCRLFMNEYDIFIPISLIEYIENKFVHDNRYDVSDENINKFMIELSMLSVNNYKINELDEFMCKELFQGKLRKLLNDRVYQYIWKQNMVKVVKKYFNNPPQTINLLNYVWRIRNKLISYYCDLCQQRMIQRYCKFFKCGHSFCNKCRLNMMENNNICKICNVKIDLKQYYKYYITLRDFDNI